MRFDPPRKTNDWSSEKVFLKMINNKKVMVKMRNPRKYLPFVKFRLNMKSTVETLDYHFDWIQCFTAYLLDQYFIVKIVFDTHINLSFLHLWIVCQGCVSKGTKSKEVQWYRTSLVYIISMRSKVQNVLEFWKTCCRPFRDINKSITDIIY